MSDREIIEITVEPNESKQMKEQKVKVYDWIEKHCDAFSFHEEMETCSQVEFHLKFYDEVSFFVCLYVIREQQKWFSKKEFCRETRYCHKGTYRVQQFPCITGDKENTRTCTEYVQIFSSQQAA